MAVDTVDGGESHFAPPKKRFYSQQRTMVSHHFKVPCNHCFNCRYGFATKSPELHVPRAEPNGLKSHSRVLVYVEFAGHKSCGFSWPNTDALGHVWSQIRTACLSMGSLVTHGCKLQYIGTDGSDRPMAISLMVSLKQTRSLYKEFRHRIPSITERSSLPTPFCVDTASSVSHSGPELHCMQACMFVRRNSSVTTISANASLQPWC